VYVGPYGVVEVLTRIAFREVRHVIRENSYSYTLRCIHDGPRGARNVTLSFYTANHLTLFSFALEKMGTGMRDEGVGTEAIVSRARFVCGQPPFEGLNWGLGNIFDWADWNSVEWGANPDHIRLIHPFFNVQEVWLSKPSGKLVLWLLDEEMQEGFLHHAEEGQVVLTSFHRTPIDALIEAGQYGPGSWAPEDVPIM
jgi:hypothetical protein